MPHLPDFVGNIVGKEMQWQRMVQWVVKGGMEGQQGIDDEGMEACEKATVEKSQGDSVGMQQLEED
jgi:hypothetical protein